MKTKINLQDIPKDKALQGYLWMSDEQTPDLYFDEKITKFPSETANPFIIEGNLWDKVDQTSYLIRFIDGEYFVYRFALQNIDKDQNQIEEYSYLPHRMPGIKELHFKEIWQPVPDPLCEGFEVLKPAFVAFTGFKE